MNPQKSPSKMDVGTRSMVNAFSRLKLNSELVPVKMYIITEAVMLETSKGMSEAIVRSIISTSRVKTTPAIGALNIPAIAPLAPAPRRTIMDLWSSLKNCPRFDPMAEPVNTIADSAPTDPPKPIVIPLAMRLDQQLCFFK